MAQNEIEIQKILADEQKFNKILAEYTKTYHLFMEDIMKQSKLKKDFGDYFDKVIHEGNGSYIYINNFGVTHKYKSHYCPNYTFILFVKLLCICFLWF